MKDQSVDDAKQKKLPVDGELLSGAVIELNISRRSVGLYPPEHPIIRDSIEKAYSYLQRLFEIRSQITLGIAKDTLVIDEYVLERKNPVFREFAVSLHGKGVASLTFYSGLTPGELVILHEVITIFEGPTGDRLVECAQERGLRHIRIDPVDLSFFTFKEGLVKQGGVERRLWEDYVYGLLEGRLSDSEAEGVIRTLEPSEMAAFLNERMPENASEEAYERVIVGYLRGKDRHRALDKFRSFAESLNPSLKIRFLQRALRLEPLEKGEIEELLAGLEHGDLPIMLDSLKDTALALPEGLPDLMNKLIGARSAKGLCSTSMGDSVIIDDLTLMRKGLAAVRLDVDQTGVDEGYRQDLLRMIKGIEAETGPLTEEFAAQTGEAVIDGRFTSLIIDLIETAHSSPDQRLRLFEKLSTMAGAFLDTGRFDELCSIHAFLEAGACTGAFADEASGVLEYSFRSPDFIDRLIDSLRLWGRYKREAAETLVLSLRREITGPLFDALSEPSDSSTRKFYLHLLGALGHSVLPEAARRLSDERWYVVRNMIYLIRESGGKEYVNRIRHFAKDKNRKICVEAVRTLLHFKTPDALSYLKLYFRSDDPELRRYAVTLAGSYKVKEAVMPLIGLLEKKDLLETDTSYKAAVVKALAQIGDARAVEAFIRLYTSRLSFFHGVDNQLRLELFRNLDAFSPDAVKPLVELGLSSKNSDIQALCRKYREKIQSSRSTTGV